MSSVHLTGFIAPIEDAAPDEAAWDAEGDIEPEPPADPVVPGRPEDDTDPDNGSAARRMLPNSLGLTVLLRTEITDIEAVITWGDYVTEPPVEEMVLIDDQANNLHKWNGGASRGRSACRSALKTAARGSRSPDSAAPQVGLALETHSRVYTVEQPDGTHQRVRALTVVLGNCRRPARRRYADVCFAFQARVALLCPSGFVPRRDLSCLSAQDEDRRLSDLHYRDVTEYAVGHNTSAGWTQDAGGEVRAP